MTTKKQVTINVRTVGQAFACVGQVLRAGKPIHTTEPCPYGFRARAHERAANWAETNGYDVK